MRSYVDLFISNILEKLKALTLTVVQAEIKSVRERKAQAGVGEGQHHTCVGDNTGLWGKDEGVMRLIQGWKGKIQG